MMKVREFLWSWAKWMYWILGLALVLGVSYILFNQLNRETAAILFFIGGILALYFYYVKWFVIPEKQGAWPPHVSPCPDYLTLVSPGDGNTEPAMCKDFVGVSANGRLQKSAPSDTNVSLANPNYTFAVPINRKTPSGKVERVPISDICDRVQQYGLTWQSMCPDA